MRGNYHTYVHTYGHTRCKCAVTQGHTRCECAVTHGYTRCKCAVTQGHTMDYHTYVRTYGHTRCKCAVLANPNHDVLLTLPHNLLLLSFTLLREQSGYTIYDTRVSKMTAASIDAHACARQ